MTEIETKSSVTILEVNAEELKSDTKQAIIVTPHWSRRVLVVLEIAGAKYTVSVSALEKAIANAQNAHSY